MSKNKKEEIDIKSLQKAYLVKIESKKGYLTLEEVSGYDYMLPIKWETEEYNRALTQKENLKITVKPIIIKKPSKISIPSEVKEYLTGEAFNYAFVKEKMYYDGDKYRRLYIKKSKHKKLDSFILVWKYLYKECNPIITIDDVFEYMRQCGDIDEYRKKLQKLKDNTNIVRIDVKERERQEKEDKIKHENIQSMKYTLFNVGYDELASNPKLIDVCVDIISNDNGYLKTAPIDVVIKRIKEEYPHLSNNDCTSVAIILLRLQASDEKSKQKIK
jgi:hypothetical protein